MTGFAALGLVSAESNSVQEGILGGLSLAPGIPFPDAETGISKGAARMSLLASPSFAAGHAAGVSRSSENPEVTECERGSWISKRRCDGRCINQSPNRGNECRHVVTGFFAYRAVPTNSRALHVFRHHVIDLWRRSLRRRSQERSHDLGPNQKAGRRLSSARPYHSSLAARALCHRNTHGGCRSRKSHPRELAAEGKSRQYPIRCLPSSACLRFSSLTGSDRGGSWKSRISFFVTSSTSRSGVHRIVRGCVGATGRCCHGCAGFGRAYSGWPGSCSQRRYCGRTEQAFAPIGAGDPELD